MSESPQLMDINEAAEILRVSPFTVRRWAAEGRLRRIKLGSRTLLDPADVKRLIETAKANAAAAQPVAV